MGSSPEKLVFEIGNRLSQLRLNKDSLVKLLKQASSALSELKQSPSLQRALEPLCSSLVKKNLLSHKDKDVQLLVAVCFSEIMRILVPEPPFSDEVLKEVFSLIISTFTDLGDIGSPYFIRRVRILEIVAALKCCVLMLDIGCEDLVLQMFNVFFSVIRDDHQGSLFNAMSAIMILIIEEKVSPPIMEVILLNLLKGEKDDSSAPSRLATTIIKSSAAKLEPFICSLLTSCISEDSFTHNEIKKFYHEIIFALYKCSPQMLIAVLPNLVQELVKDQVDVRMKAVHLIGKIFVQSKLQAAQEYHLLYSEFIKRLSDKSAEVRIRALESAKECYMCNTSAPATHEILTAFEGRLLDFDEKVRTRAVIVVCDLAMSCLSPFPSKLVLQASERLRDKKVTVRRGTMQKLLQLYRSYCEKCSEGLVVHADHYEQIPSKIIILCLDKNCLEFRPQDLELVLAEDLFPPLLSVEQRVDHWMRSFSYFLPSHKRALSFILSEKRRLHVEMRKYIQLREKEKVNPSEEVHQRISASLVEMSNSFSDTSKAKLYLQKIHQMKDNHIFKVLLELLEEQTPSVVAQEIRDAALSRIGDKHPCYDFCKILCLKCSHSIFTVEHVLCFLKSCLFKRCATSNLKDEFAFDLLSEPCAVVRMLKTELVMLSAVKVVVNAFPALLKGSEKYFLKLFSEDSSQSREKLLQMLNRVGRHISIRLSDIYPFLEKICLEGTRAQSKSAVSAIASLVDNSDQSILSKFYKKLVISLRDGQNIPTILQSLGCVAQYTSIAFESLVQISEYIFSKIFRSTKVPSSCEQTLCAGISVCNTLCKLKVYGLKTLVKSFLAYKITSVKHQFGALLSFLLKILEENDFLEDTSRSDQAHLRLAAAKAVIRLSTRWDSHIFPRLFHLTIMTARDPSSAVRVGFLKKTQILLKKHAIPGRYSCAFALAPPDCSQELEANPKDYLAEFIEDYSREAWMCENSSLHDEDKGAVMSRPEYLVVYLIHTLAHSQDFPSEDCEENDDVYVRFFWPVNVVLQTLIAPSSDGSTSDTTHTAANLLGIFRAISKADDALDAQFTPKLQILCRIGLLMVKKLIHEAKPLSKGPQSLYLPSSFYTVNHKRKCNEMHHNIESLVERILVVSSNPEFTDPEDKRRHSYEENILRSNMQKQLRGKRTASNTTKVKAKAEKEICQEHKSAVYISPSETPCCKVKDKHALSSLGLINMNSEHDECLDESHETLVPEKGWEQFISSCDSAVTQPSFPDSQVSVEILDCIPGKKSDVNHTHSPSESTDNKKYKDEIRLRTEESSMDGSDTSLDELAALFGGGTASPKKRRGITVKEKSHQMTGRNKRLKSTAAVSKRSESTEDQRLKHVTRGSKRST